MRGSLLRTGGTAALTALILFGAHPAAQARDGIGVGGAAALGVLGGVVAGTAIASANNRPVYAAPPPAYVEEVCHIERRGFIDPYGVEHIRRVRVCE
ncbi:hypothetical protein [Methylobacterium sp. J-077]|uniref:hypothetical protein n=1 Tax=Methylobacterium sp. J-077 TaxID=2836656 RepID=UPI001FBB8390|nr:hypothetical protein [Methylobacterium sp. J-077]MCJ2121033.1 hypothetical protein [Methylobacterium sp. J-077]